MGSILGSFFVIFCSRSTLRHKTRHFSQMCVFPRREYDLEGQQRPQIDSKSVREASKRQLFRSENSTSILDRFFPDLASQMASPGAPRGDPFRHQDRSASRTDVGLLLQLPQDRPRTAPGLPKGRPGPPQRPPRSPPDPPKGRPGPPKGLPRLPWMNTFRPPRLKRRLLGKMSVAAEESHDKCHKVRAKLCPLSSFFFFLVFFCATFCFCFFFFFFYCLLSFSPLLLSPR